MVASHWLAIDGQCLLGAMCLAFRNEMQIRWSHSGSTRFLFLQILDDIFGSETVVYAVLHHERLNGDPLETRWRLVFRPYKHISKFGYAKIWFSLFSALKPYWVTTEFGPNKPLRRFRKILKIIPLLTWVWCFVKKFRKKMILDHHLL